MNKLSEPAIDDEKVFVDVAKSKTYKNDHCKGCQLPKISCETCTHGNRGKILNLKDRVFARYQFYLQNSNNLNVIKPIKIMSQDEEKLMKDSYKTSKMFQKVKRQLLENIPEKRRGMCPFCMISEPTTFDHYFSESEYPEYIIFAPNLVPCCSHCNSVKGNLLFMGDGTSQKRTFIHFYYDEVPQTQYLKAKFSVDNKIPQVSFYLDFEDDSEVINIIKNHFNKLHLLERYKAQSNGILSTECEEIRVWLSGGMSVEQCVQLLQIKAQASQKTNGDNYWEACLYKAMSESEEQLIKLI